MFKNLFSLDEDDLSRQVAGRRWGSDLANQLATKVVELDKEYKARLETAGRTWKIYAKSIEHVGNMYGISWGIHTF